MIRGQFFRSLHFCTQAFQRLQSAREAWDTAREKPASASSGGRPRTAASSDGLVNVPTEGDEKEFRVRGFMVLLTYFGDWCLPSWRKFLAFVGKQLRPWGVLRWRATFEESSAGKLHAHLALQFRSAVDRAAKHFAWEGRLPNASSKNNVAREAHCHCVCARSLRSLLEPLLRHNCARLRKGHDKQN